MGPSDAGRDQSNATRKMWLSVKHCHRREFCVGIGRAQRSASGFFSTSPRSPWGKLMRSVRTELCGAYLRWRGHVSADALSEGNVAVVTGAGSGIGAGIARAVVARGVRVVLAGVAADRIEALARELREGGATVMCVPTDVSDAVEVDELANAAADAFGAVNLLVNNAGIETTGRTWEIDKGRWDTTMGINVTGVYHGVRSFVPAMIAAGVPAHVVNLASVGSLTIGPFQTPYLVSKHAVLALT